MEALKCACSQGNSWVMPLEIHILTHTLTQCMQCMFILMHAYTHLSTWMCVYRHGQITYLQWHFLCRLINAHTLSETAE
jgi:hypothetical protein